MCKFVIIHAKNWTVGTNGICYEIHDTVTFDPKKDLENQMRKYSYRFFYDKGRNPLKLRNEIFCRKRHILKGDGSIFAEKIKIFENESTNELLGFIPMECFIW